MVESRNTLYDVCMLRQSFFEETNTHTNDKE